jgi:hypothetical protein
VVPLRMPSQRKLNGFSRERLLRVYLREAARLRRFAASATTGPVKARLLEEAERQERLAEHLKKDES